MFFTYLSVSISSLVELLAVETNTFLVSLICFRNLHAGSMVPGLACFALFLIHDHESVKQILQSNEPKQQQPLKAKITVHFCEQRESCRPVTIFFVFSIAILEAVPAVRIFHFQDGGHVTNPAGLPPCILTWKRKSCPMPLSWAKHWRLKPANPALFPRMSPGSLWGLKVI